MKKLIVVGLFLNAALFVTGWCKPLAVAEIRGAAGATPCDAEPEQ